MKNILYIPFFILFFSFSRCLAQDVDVDVIGKNINTMIRYEEDMKSKVFTADDNLAIAEGMASIMYRRTESDVPDLIVHYTFDKKDSLVREVMFEWDVRNFEKQDNNPKSMDVVQAFIAKYNRMLKSLQIRYGKGVSKGDLTDLGKIRQYGGLQRSDTWTVKKKRSQIQMYMVLSNYYGQHDDGIHITTHRIRIQVSETGR